MDLLALHGSVLPAASSWLPPGLSSFLFPFLPNTHTCARAFSHSYTHTRARARVLTLSLTYARTHGLSFTHSLCSLLLSFSCLSLSTFIWFRMGSRMQQPFSTGSIIIIVLPLSLPPSFALSLSLSLNHSLPVSLSLYTCLQQFSHTHIKHTRGWTQCPRMGAASVQRCSCHDIWSDMALKMSMCTSNNHC